MSNHTAGVWTHDSQEALHIRAEDGGLIATLGWSNGRHFSAGRRTAEQVMANARLISKAPTMLSLLERIYTECDERDGGGDASFSGELLEELRRFVKEMQK